VSSYTIYLFFTAQTLPLPQNRIEQIENVIVVSNIAQTLPILLIPLLIVSWRYTRQAVILFCLGTSLLDIVIIVVFVPLGATNLTIAFSLISFRLIILGLVGLIVNRLVAVQVTQAQTLRDTNARLRDYATTREHLIASQERNRLAREMHDTLAHALAAATVQLEAIQVIWDTQPERAKQLVQKSAETMRSGLQDTRRALQALRAEPLESVGFVASIELLAESIRGRFEVTVTVEAPVDVVWLTQEQEHIVYRIVQEALFNSGQHAQAQHITVKLHETDQTLCLSVIDDGIGFDPAAIDTHNHFGVQGMRERADIIGAKLVVASQTGQGTQIQMNLQR
jgi:signal transduction histidine kinase